MAIFYTPESSAVNGVGILTTDKTGIMGAIELEHPIFQIIHPAEEALRKSFIRKVYNRLAVNILLGVALIHLCWKIPQIGEFFEEYLAGYGLLFIFTSVFTFVVDYYDILKRNTPINYICTDVIIICFGFLIGGGFYEPRDASIAALAVVIISIFIAAIAHWIKFDATNWSSVIGLLNHLSPWVLLLVIILFQNAIVYFVISSFYLIFNGLCLFLHIQLILGRWKKFLPLEEYVYGAFLLFVDFGNMFFFTRFISYLYFEWF